MQKFKRTKIIATIGPATDSYETVKGLIKAGANGIRLNFSHGTYDERTRQIEWIRRASKELGKPVAIIQDLQGPKIRLGDFNGTIVVTQGQTLNFQYNADYLATGNIPIQYDLSKKVKPGERIYLYDGKVHTVVTSVDGDVIQAKVDNDGELVKRKGMNLPDTDFSGDIITPKDRDDLQYGATQDIDYVALSFVQTADDIENLKQLLKTMNSTSKIIAKVETASAVNNIEAIVQASDAVMVARGDLAVETLAESVPIVQRQIIGLGQHYVKPTIVATQMLASMTDMPDPTRAEVSDVATAVILGADSVMLSDETANGKYPIEAVSTMKRIILYTEENDKSIDQFPKPEDKSNRTSIAKAIISLSENIGAKATVIETKSGATALRISAFRRTIPIIAVTDDAKTAQQLAIIYNVKSFIRPADEQAAGKLIDWLKQTDILHKDDIVVTASGRYPGVIGTTDTIKVRVLD